MSKTASEQITIRKLNIVKVIDEKYLAHFEDKGFRRIGKDGKPIASEADKVDEEIATMKSSAKILTDKIAELEKAAEEKAKDHEAAVKELTDKIAELEKAAEEKAKK